MDVLNKIDLKDGTTFSGIVDYVTTKHIYFFDIDPDKHPDFLMLAILWMGNASHMRFSVYCSIHYPGIILPKAILIPINIIEGANKPINVTETPKQRKRILKI